MRLALARFSRPISENCPVPVGKRQIIRSHSLLSAGVERKNESRKGPFSLQVWMAQGPGVGVVISCVVRCCGVVEGKLSYFEHDFLKSRINMIIIHI